LDGYGLTALIFAREVSGPLTSLVKAIDRQLDETSARLGKRPDRLGVFVIFCNDDAKMNERLKDLAARERLRHVVLCTHNSAGPRRYQVAREADLTVVVYDPNEEVTANFPLRKGVLDEKKGKDILQAITRALPKR
jgi:hypothetical protein